MKTWTESALMISPLSRFASSSARRLFPAPVGPDITITLSFFFLFTAQAVENTRRRKRWRCMGLSGRQHVRSPLSILSLSLYKLHFLFFLIRRRFPGFRIQILLNATVSQFKLLLLFLDSWLNQFYVFFYYYYILHHI